MPWDPTKPAGTDAANTIDTTAGGNFSALDTWASALTDGISTGAATLIQVLRAANATIARFRSAAGDTNDRFRWDLNGRMEWGPGNATPDILLERVAANLLATASGDAIANALNRTGVTTDVTNTVVETDLFNFSVPANTLGTNRILRLTLIGDILMNSGTSPTLTLRFKYGAMLATAVLTLTLGTTRKAMRLAYEVYASDATNLGRAMPQVFVYEAPSSAATVVTMQAIDTANLKGGITTGFIIDTTIAQSLIITAEWSSASTNLSVRALQSVLEVV